MSETKTFWEIEQDYLNDYKNFEYDLEHAYTLQDAIACGASMTYLNGRMVGYMFQHGKPELYEQFKGKDLSKIKVMFDRIVRDEDGYSDAYFNEVKE